MRNTTQNHGSTRNRMFHTISRTVSPSEFGVPSPAELWKMRQQAGMSQQDLANLAGMSTNQISSYENGVHRPNVRSLESLLEVFDIVLDE